VKLQGAVLGRGYVEGGAVVVIARLPFQVKLQGPVLGAGYVEGGAVVAIARLPSQGPVLGAGYVQVIDGCPVLCPAALPNESFPGLG